jgi:transglutaminase-like putative cysteine protease
MRVDRAFLKSFYLSLAWGCACFAYVAFLEYPWEVLYAAPPLALLLAVAYAAEGRWSLSIRVSNGLALAVAACAGAYFSRFFSQGGPKLDADWPLRVLPHMGFWLLVMMVLKLFRPKHVGDYWVIYGMGLLAVGLGCLLESDFPLGLLLIGYTFTSAWSLGLFYLHREHLRTLRGNQAESGVQPAPVMPWPYLGLAQTALRYLLVGGIAAVLFVLTPRHLGLGWEENVIRSMQLQSGLGDSTLDLNRTGSLRLSQEIAFEVKAEDANGLPKLNLNSGQRWRRNILNHYEAGRWSYVPRGAAEGRRNRQPTAADNAANADGALPDLGEAQYFLRYTFNGQLRWQLILAEPVVLPPAGSPVVFFLDGEAQPVPAIRHADGELRFPMRRRHGLYRSYRQVTAPLPDPDIGPPVNVDDPQLDSYRQLPSLPGLQERTAELLEKLVQRGQLRQEDLVTDGDDRPPSERHERVARALEGYLAQSGEFTYSLNLKRKDSDVDPVVDFLVNVKEGHCARYASALAAMLRTQGVPSRVVLGFRGVDDLGGGQYVVRQNNAHSWVEVLVQRLGPDGVPRHHWLTLDPTPGEDVTLRDLSWWGRVWHGVRQSGAEFWRNFVTDYNPRQQEALWRQLASTLSFDRSGQGLTGWLAAGCLPLAIILAWQWHRQRQRRATMPMPHAEAAFYLRLLAIAARRCRLRPLPTQTPLEFAEALIGFLRPHAESNTWAEFPRAVVEMYYRVRYARQPLLEAERLEIDRRLTEFDDILARRRRTPAAIENQVAAS